MVARSWKGWTRAEDADRYVGYLEQTGVRALAQTLGNLGVHVLRRSEGDRAEFVVLSLWESHDAIRAFAGDDITQAVFYPEDERYLVERESQVSHYDVVASA